MARRPSLDYAAGGIIDQLRQQRREEDQGRTQRLNMAIAGIIKGLETGGQLWEKQREKKLAELQRLAPMAASQVMEAESRAPKDLIGRLGQERVQSYEKKYGYPEQDPVSRIAPVAPVAPEIPEPVRPKPSPESFDRHPMWDIRPLEEGDDRAVGYGQDQPVVQEAAPPGYPVPPPGHAEESWRRSAGEFGGKRITKEGFEQMLGEAQGQYATEAANALAKQLGVTPERAKREIEVARFLVLKEGAAQAAAIAKEKRGYASAEGIAQKKLESAETIAGVKTTATAKKQKFEAEAKTDLAKMNNKFEGRQRDLDRDLKRDLAIIKKGDGSPKIEMEIDKTIDKKIGEYNRMYQRTWAAVASGANLNTIDTNRVMTSYGMQILAWEKYKQDRKTISVSEPETPTPEEVSNYMDRVSRGEVRDWNFDPHRAD